MVYPTPQPRPVRNAFLYMVAVAIPLALEIDLVGVAKLPIVEIRRAEQQRHHFAGIKGGARVPAQAARLMRAYLCDWRPTNWPKGIKVAKPWPGHERA